MNKKFFSCLAFLLVFFVLSAQNDHSKFQKIVEQIQPLEQVQWTKVVDVLDENEYSFISADDKNFFYTGRIDWTEPEAPVLIWQGTSVKFNFTGTKLGLRFIPKGSRCAYYNIIIDGKIYLLQLEGSMECDYIFGGKLSKGNHSCEIYKRNEAQSDTDIFLGVDIAPDAKFGPKPEAKKLYIEFYGDSITAGVCDETPGNDNYNDMVQHNAYTSYGAIAGRMLNADVANYAVGGTGASVSWNSYIISRDWKGMTAYPGSKEYDFSGRKPDIIVVNIGQNDYGLPQSKGEKFPATFKDDYYKFISELREAYPKAWIVCATGGMSAIGSSRALQTGIQNAIKQMNDNKIVFYKYKAFTYDHPRVDTHQQMAEELVAFLKEQKIVK